MFDKYIEKLKEELVQETQKLIQISSVIASSDNPSKPFGENINKALEHTLELGERLGFRTKNIDGYCGYIEFGEGEELVGIVGHLDVVPEGENWTYPPFSGKIINNNIYGRGAIDDKGPVISSLYAMKTIMDNCKVHKRVRLILGLNEENSWKCINYYKQHEEIPNIGFSPDADFPCIYAEKSILTSYLEMDYSNFLDKDIVISDIDCNGNALNVVPKICSCILKINSDKFSMNDFINTIKQIKEKYDYEIDIYKINNEQLKLTCYGVQAHSAHPDLGVNAISRLIIILDNIFKEYKIDIELFDFFNKYIGIQYNGENLGIDFEDESGKLTLNVGRLALEDSALKIGMNLRVPIHTSITDIENSFTEHLDSYTSVIYKTTNHMPYLYISKDDYLIRTLCKIYNEETNSSLEPIAIGGATFARAFPNCVSFGANLPGHKDMCHQTDEFISIDNLMLACKIYTRAIYELSDCT